MRITMLHSTLLFVTAFMLLLLLSCVKECFDTPQAETGKVQLELFTRAYDYPVPVVRAGTDEYGVNYELWLLVFKGHDNNATFVEAVKSYFISGINKTYAEFTRQPVDDYQILILANTQVQTNFFTQDGTPHHFAANDFATTFAGSTLSFVCENLLTEPLNNPQTTVPFASSRIPMTHLLKGLTAIDESTQIGSETNKLKLMRATARLDMRNYAPNFEMLGITLAANIARQTRWHNLDIATAFPQSAATVNYSKETTPGIYQDLVAFDSSGSSENDPIYFYESSRLDNPYIIVHAKYNGNECYYKLALVDAARTAIDLKRNYCYTFTIGSVAGQGWDTMQDAIASPSYNNTIVSTTLTIDRVSAHESTAFGDYFLSVSNSRYVAYTNNASAADVYTVSNVFYGGTIPLDIAEVKMTLAGATFENGTTTLSLGTSPLPVNSTEIKLKNFTGNTAKLDIKLGNIIKRITIEKKPALAANAMLELHTDLGVDCLSATVDNGALSWITLHPSGSDNRNDIGHIVVDDGQIRMRVLSASSSRTGTVYLSTINVPNIGQRIKIDVIQ